MIFNFPTFSIRISYGNVHLLPTKSQIEMLDKSGARMHIRNSITRRMRFFKFFTWKKIIVSCEGKCKLEILIMLDFDKKLLF